MKTSSFMLVTMVFQTLYFLVDLYWVGRLGKEAVAGVGIAGNLMFVVLAITQMLGVGTTTLISHAVGQADRARARVVFTQAQLLSLVVGGVFFVLATLLRDSYVAALSADAATNALATDYLRWFIPAMALQFALVAMAAALRATGNFRPGMIVQTSTVIINIVLAPILIFGWGTGHAYGVAGAAMSSLVALVVGVVWMAWFFVPAESYLKFLGAEARPHLGTWAQMLKIGLPAGAEFGLMAVYMFIVYAVTRPFGAAAQAGFGIGQRVLQSGFMPVVALGFAVAPVAGQNFGAHKHERVRETFRTAAIISVVGMAVLALLCHIAPAAMIGFFSDDPEVVAVGEEFLRISSWNFVASGLVFVGASMFQAMGNTIPSLLTSFVRIVVVAIPVVLLARIEGFQLRWIWYLSVASVTLQMVLNMWLLRREFRKRLSGTHHAVVPVTEPTIGEGTYGG